MNTFPTTTTGTRVTWRCTGSNGYCHYTTTSRLPATEAAALRAALGLRWQKLVSREGALRWEAETPSAFFTIFQQEAEAPNH